MFGLATSPMTRYGTCHATSWCVMLSTLGTAEAFSVAIEEALRDTSTAFVGVKPHFWGCRVAAPWWPVIMLLGVDVGPSCCPRLMNTAIRSIVVAFLFPNQILGLCRLAH